MKQIEELLPWKTTHIALRPYDGLWSMNPSIHFDGTLWRCVLRCCDYAMPDGVTIRSKSAGTVGQQTKNAMVIFDPQSWQPASIFKMREKDGLPRASCVHAGYEDMRLFKTDKGGLQGIAAALHLKRDRPAAEGRSQHQPPEQVLLSFDENYDIVGACPIRGDGWSGTPQKNWVPFDHCAEPRFLYSINKGALFDDRGSIHGEGARVRSPSAARPIAPSVVDGAGALLTLAPLEEEPVPLPREVPATPREREDRPRPKQPARRLPIRGGDVQILRGGRIAVDAMSSRPSSRASSRGPSKGAEDATRMLGSGRVRLPQYDGLRGGTQLSQVGEDVWLGIGHEMKFVNSKKYYWHTWYLVDAMGKLLATSDSMKLASNGIEFAAGMAIDGDRVVVSFGVDDMECRLGETKLSAVLGVLKPLGR
jgi:hypothetical protein